MEFRMYQDVVLTTDLPEQGLCAGDVGTVVEHHRKPDGTEGYSVEFFDMTGRTLAVATVPNGSLRAPNAADCPSVRVRVH